MDLVSFSLEKHFFNSIIFSMPKLQKFDAGMHYLQVEEEVVLAYHAKGSKRALCTIKNTPVHCAFLSMKNGGYYIVLGSKICSALKLKEGDELEPIFSDDDSDYQFEMPEEFAEVLYQDTEAMEIFENLTDGNKRGLMYIVTGVKSSDKRIERALKIVEKLKVGVTSPRLMLK
jgi:Bacteriocin-protection, YdeI or OmpD-Associated/Domain of unknown function (DUF1905)